MKTLSLLVVTYNTGALIRECLQGIVQMPLNVEVIVVDNASSDETAQIIAAEFPSIKLIVNEKNLGFGAANNLGFKASSGAVIVLVNPDLILTSEAVSTLMEYLEAHPDVGIVGPRTHDSDGTIALTARAPYTPFRILAKYWGLDRFVPSLVYGHYQTLAKNAVKAFDAAWLQGSCLAMRREDYQQLSGFDEGFFLFAEDTDLCERALLLGKRIVYLPDANVTHHGSTTVSRYPLIRVRNYHLSPLYYFRKRHRHSAVWFLKMVFILELTGKASMRWLKTRFRRDPINDAKMQAEWQVLNDVWKY